MQLTPSTTEDEIRSELQQAAVSSYGSERAAALSKRLADTAHALWLIAQERIDLLDEEPDRDGP